MADGRTEAGITTATDSNLRLDVSVLTDRTGGRTALMDKNGLYIFEESVEEQIAQYLIREQEKSAYYKSSVFSEDTTNEDRELNYIKSHVFMQISSVSDRTAPEAKKDNGASLWLTAGIAVTGIVITVLYWRRMKKAREKRIADLDNRYDE